MAGVSKFYDESAKEGERSDFSSDTKELIDFIKNIQDKEYLD